MVTLQQRKIVRAASVSVYGAVLFLAVKVTAYFLTDSKAVLSDALESVINVATALFLLVSVRLSIRPADSSHPYGHGKIEAFSAGIEGGLISLAAIVIFMEALPAFFTPEAPRQAGIGIVLLGSAGCGNMLLGSYLMHSGKKYNSQALRADGHHLLTDFYTSGGVILGLVLVHFTGVAWFDPLMACLVAMWIVLPGIRLLRESVRNLMNEAEPELLDKVVAALNEMGPELLHPHKLRVLRSGGYLHIDLHIILPAHWTLEMVHRTEERLATKILERLDEQGDVMLHVDPCRNEDCGTCNLSGCDRRHLAFGGGSRLTVEQATGVRCRDGIVHRESEDRSGVVENGSDVVVL